MSINWEKINDIPVANDEVLTWYVNLEEHFNSLPEYISLLNKEELQRAERFKFVKDKNCFVVSRAVLRIVLSKYLHCEPQEIDFKANNYGKPAIDFAESGSSCDLRFNLSHSEFRAVIVVNVSQDIGVDLEYIQEKKEKGEIVKRFFTEAEYKEYLSLDDDEQLLGFYNLWTRKEAFVKALGEGMFHSLKGFTVNASPGKDAQIIAFTDNADEVGNWQLHSFKPEESYCAAISWRGPKKKIRFFRF